MRSTMKLNELETRNRDSQNRNDPVTNHRLRDSRHHHPAHTTDNYQFNESTRSVQFWVENHIFYEIVTYFFDFRFRPQTGSGAFGWKFVIFNPDLVLKS